MVAKIAPRLQFLSIVAEKAAGLRSIELTLDANYEFRWYLRRGAMERGLGDNLDFVRVLGKIQGLEKLVIKGCYAKNWPVCLERKTGVRVRAICGHCLEEREEREEDLNKEELENEKFTRELNEEQLLKFREYQQGTEILIP